MKNILFFIVLAFIVCSPLDKVGRIFENLKKESYSQVLNCLKENGIESLLKLFKENKGLKLKKSSFGQLIKDNKNSIKKTSELFHKCKVDSLVLNAIKRGIFSKKNKTANK